MREIEKFKVIEVEQSKYGSRMFLDDWDYRGEHNRFSPTPSLSSATKFDADDDEEIADDIEAIAKRYGGKVRKLRVSYSLEV